MTRNIAVQELQDISDVLKVENVRLEEEKEKLLFDQIDKPSDDKEIERCLRAMNGELEEKYHEARDLLTEFVEVTSKQKANTPEIRISQISELRIRIEEITNKVQVLNTQKKMQERVGKEISAAIQVCEQEISEKSTQLNKFRSLCVKSNKLDQSSFRS